MLPHRARLDCVNFKIRFDERHHWSYRPISAKREGGFFRLSYLHGDTNFMVIRIASLLAASALLASTLHAEFLRMEVVIRDMDCQPCSESLAAAFQRMRGVEKADVDFKTGTVRLTLAEKNRVGIDQVWDAIKRVGFTPGETKVNVRGVVKASKLEVPEIGKTFVIEGTATEGESVTLVGTIAPPPDPRAPIVIRVTK
jgi:copper chaperone CopZ